jgi:hypothetical protein
VRIVLLIGTIVLVSSCANCKPAFAPEIDDEEVEYDFFVGVRCAF